MACAGPDSGASGGSIEADHFVPSRPETGSWGWYSIDKEPVLRLQSGETDGITTLNHVLSATGADAV